jgi:hypothetical protein
VPALGIVMSIVMNGKPLKWSAASSAGTLTAGMPSRRPMTSAISRAPMPSSVAAYSCALAATFTDDRREFAARLLAVIADHSELRERAAFKHIGLTEAMAEALEKRGVPDLTASLAAAAAVETGGGVVLTGDPDGLTSLAAPYPNITVQSLP